MIRRRTPLEAQPNRGRGVSLDVRDSTPGRSSGACEELRPPEEAIHLMMDHHVHVLLHGEDTSKKVVKDIPGYHRLMLMSRAFIDTRWVVPG
jgi:hypothetical protein